MDENGRQEVVRGTKELGRVQRFCARARSEEEKGRGRRGKGREEVGWLVVLRVLDGRGK